MSLPTLALRVWYRATACIASGSSTLDEVHSVLDSAWTAYHHVPARVRIEVAIAAAEIAANILEHDCAPALQMDIQVYCNQVQIEFTDCGGPVAFDPAAAQMPDAMAERGRGLAMARRALRRLTYYRDEVGNHWRLDSNLFLTTGTH